MLALFERGVGNDAQLMTERSEPEPVVSPSGKIKRISKYPECHQWRGFSVQDRSALLAKSTANIPNDLLGKHFRYRTNVIIDCLSYEVVADSLICN